MSDTEPTEHEPRYDLVMPILPVTSKGGPLDDDAYTAAAGQGG